MGRGKTVRGSAAHSIIGRSGRLSYLAGRLCGVLPGIVYVRHWLVAIAAADLPAMPRGYTVRALAADDLTGQRIDADAAKQAQRFAAGMTCLGLFDRHGALLGVTWLGREVHDETVLRIRFRLPARTGWDGGLWIDEERRVGRAFVAIWAGVRIWLEAEGLDGTVSSIADYNAASLASHRRLGARTVGAVSVLRVGRWQWTWNGGRVRWTRGGMPEIGVAVE